MCINKHEGVAYYPDGTKEVYNPLDKAEECPSCWGTGNGHVAWNVPMAVEPENIPECGDIDCVECDLIPINEFDDGVEWDYEDDDEGEEYWSLAAASSPPPITVAPSAPQSFNNDMQTIYQSLIWQSVWSINGSSDE